MAASVTERAARRAAGVEDAIRAALAEGDGHRALNLAVRALQSEAAKLRRRRRADGALTDAALAGSIVTTAARLHAHKPASRAAIQKVPTPGELLRAFEDAAAQARGESEAAGG